MAEGDSMNGGILAGKTVVVTGGSSGIGRAVCISAAQQGAKMVIVSDVTEEPREEGAATAAEVTRLGGEAKFVLADVTESSAMDQLVAEAEPYGGVDLMVCNAGITLDADGVDVDSDDFRRLLAVNLDGVLYSAQAAARQMQERGTGGSIVLTGSMGGLNGSGKLVSYSVSKGGVINMAKALADALGPESIRVNAICPGAIETELVKTNPHTSKHSKLLAQRTPLRRLGQPSEIGDVVAFLGSDLSSFVSGTALLVDGGLLAVI
jgi:NAD(P)-dependent dehydrogenase (short-subunit alcohol dehydrogenase family)